MKLSDKFTPEQLRAIEDLEEVFGPTEIEASEVSKYYVDKYALYAAGYLESALKDFARAKMAETIDFAEIERLQQVEYARKLAERSSGVRANVMMGIFTILISKVTKIVPLGLIAFETDEDVTSLACYEGGEVLLNIVYDKQIYTLETVFADSHFKDDATFVKGSTSFRDQLSGVEAVFSYLEGRK